MKLIPLEVKIELDEEELKILDQAEVVLSQMYKVFDNPDLDNVRLGNKTEDYVQAILTTVDHLEEYI